MTEASARSVSLEIPPKPDYIVLARLALSAICRLTLLEPDDVADLKLAVSEVATERLTGTSQESVRLLFELEDADPKAVFESVYRRGVLVRDVSAYPRLSRCLRVSVGSDEENEAFLTALRHALEEQRFKKER